MYRENQAVCIFCLSYTAVTKNKSFSFLKKVCTLNIFHNVEILSLEDQNGGKKRVKQSYLKLHGLDMSNKAFSQKCNLKHSEEFTSALN